MNKYKLIGHISIGRTNKSYKCKFENEFYFIKINEDQHNNVLETEIQSQKNLEKMNFNIPKIIEGSKSFIVTEWITIEPNVCMLGKELQKLHNITSKKYGNDTSFYTGKLKLPNKWCDNWIEFFIINRFNPLMELLDKKQDFDLYITAIKICEIFSKLKHDPQPKLLHGDMNMNNYGIHKNSVYFFDSSTFYGDPLFDVACVIIWLNETDIKLFLESYEFEENDNNNKIIQIYKCWIYLTCYIQRQSKSFKKRALKLMDDVISCYKPNFPKLLHNIVKEPLALIIHGGSYNPIHKNHINNLSIVEQYLISLGHKNIQKIMIPSTDNRVTKKCKNGIKLYDRFEMMKLVCSDIMIDLSQLYGDILIENYKNIFGDIDVYIVCGQDTAQFNLDHYTSNKLIVIKRSNDTTEIIKNDRIMYLESDEKQMSSTLIRSLTEYKQMIKYLEPKVADYYLDLKQNAMNK